MKPIVRECKKIFHAWSAARTSTFGAAVAYYTVFSIAPLVIISISIVNLFFDSAEAQMTIIAQFQKTFGESGAEFIRGLIDAKTSGGASVALAIVGFIAIFIGATGIFTQLQAALDTIFNNLPEKKLSGFFNIILRNLLSLGMILSVGFLLIVSLVASSVITSLSEQISINVRGALTLAQIADITLSYLLISAFLACMYKFLPTKRLPWKSALVGGVLGGLFFTIGKHALGIYLGSSNVLTAYGAASALVLLILWTFYMSQIFFLSGILVKLYAVPDKNKARS